MKICNLQTTSFILLALLVTVNEASLLSDFYLRLFKSFNRSSAKTQRDGAIQDREEISSADVSLTSSTNRPPNMSGYNGANDEVYNRNGNTNIFAPTSPEINREDTHVSRSPAGPVLPTFTLATDWPIFLEDKITSEEPADVSMMPVRVVPVSIQQTVARPNPNVDLNPPRRPNPPQNMNVNLSVRANPPQNMDVNSTAGPKPTENAETNPPARPTPPQNVNITPTVSGDSLNAHIGNVVQVAHNNAVYLRHSKLRDVIVQDRGDILLPVLQVDKTDENTRGNLDKPLVIKADSSTDDVTGELLLMADDDPTMFDNDVITEIDPPISAEVEQSLRDILNDETDGQNHLNAATLAKANHPLQDFMAIWLESKIIKVQKGTVKV